MALLNCQDGLTGQNIIDAINENTKNLPQLSVGSTGTPQDRVTMTYDTAEGVIRFPIGQYIFGAKVGTKSLASTNIPLINGYHEVEYSTSNRYLVYNTSTELMRGIDNYNLSEDGDVVVAMIHGASGSVLSYNSTGYSVDGVDYVNWSDKSSLTPESLDDNRILYNYVKGQEEAANRFGLPFLNIWQKGGINQFNYEDYMFSSSDLLHMNADGYNKWTVPTTKFIQNSCDSLSLVGKTMGIFGGSWSVRTAGDALKSTWTSELGVIITNYGVAGAGFTTTGNDINSQIASASSHDIYLLWCSTNDCSTNAEIGNMQSTIDLTSQNGAIGKAVQDLITINPECRILLLSSGPAFNDPINWDAGYVRT